MHIIAGPNGAGKTTFASEFLPDYANCPEFVNADLLAKGLSPFYPEAAAIEAGRLMLKQIDKLMKKKSDFGFETTLSGRTFVRLIDRLREQNYIVKLYFLWLPDVELALERVAERVRRGGHNIPEAIIKRIYQAGIHNFINKYRHRAEEWILFDNSNVQLHIIGWLKYGEVAVYDETLNNRILTEAAR